MAPRRRVLVDSDDEDGSTIPTTATSNDGEDFEVECILLEQIDEDDELVYLVKEVGRPAKDATFEPASALQGHSSILEAWEEKKNRVASGADKPFDIDRWIRGGYGQDKDVQNGTDSSTEAAGLSQMSEPIIEDRCIEIDSTSLLRHESGHATPLAIEKVATVTGSAILALAAAHSCSEPVEERQHTLSISPEVQNKPQRLQVLIPTAQMSSGTAVGLSSSIYPTATIQEESDAIAGRAPAVSDKYMNTVVNSTTKSLREHPVASNNSVAKALTATNALMTSTTANDATTPPLLETCNDHDIVHISSDERGIPDCTRSRQGRNMAAITVSPTRRDPTASHATKSTLISVKASLPEVHDPQPQASKSISPVKSADVSKASVSSTVHKTMSKDSQATTQSPLRQYELQPGPISNSSKPVTWSATASPLEPDPRITPNKPKPKPRMSIPDTTSSMPTPANQLSGSALFTSTSIRRRAQKRAGEERAPDLTALKIVNIGQQKVNKPLDEQLKELEEQQGRKKSAKQVVPFTSPVSRRSLPDEASTGSFAPSQLMQFVSGIESMKTTERPKNNPSTKAVPKKTYSMQSFLGARVGKQSFVLAVSNRHDASPISAGTSMQSQSPAHELAQKPNSASPPRSSSCPSLPAAAPRSQAVPPRPSHIVFGEDPFGPTKKSATNVTEPQNEAMKTNQPQSPQLPRPRPSLDPAYCGRSLRDSPLSRDRSPNSNSCATSSDTDSGLFARDERSSIQGNQVAVEVSSAANKHGWTRLTPRGVTCWYWRNAGCQKGEKCKFAHADTGIYDFKQNTIHSRSPKDRQERGLSRATSSSITAAQTSLSPSVSTRQGQPPYLVRDVSTPVIKATNLALKRTFHVGGTRLNLASPIGGHQLACEFAFMSQKEKDLANDLLGPAFFNTTHALTVVNCPEFQHRYGSCISQAAHFPVGLIAEAQLRSTGAPACRMSLMAPGKIGLVLRDSVIVVVFVAALDTCEATAMPMITTEKLHTLFRLLPRDGTRSNLGFRPMPGLSSIQLLSVLEADRELLPKDDKPSWTAMIMSRSQDAQFVNSLSHIFRAIGYTVSDAGDLNTADRNSRFLLVLCSHVDPSDIVGLASQLQRCDFRVLGIELDGSGALQTRLMFPHHDVVLLTDDIILNHPELAMKIMLQINRRYRSSKDKGLQHGCLVVRPGIKHWLRSLMFSNADEAPEVRVIWENLVQAYDKLCPEEDEEPYNRPVPDGDALVVSIDEDTSSGYDSTKLVDWFAGWAVMHRYEYPRFIVLHRCETRSLLGTNLQAVNRAQLPSWTSRFQHLRVEDPTQWLAVQANKEKASKGK